MNFQGDLRELFFSNEWWKQEYKRHTERFTILLLCLYVLGSFMETCFYYLV